MEHGATIKHDQKKSPKTGDWRYMYPEVDGKKCIGCGTCVPFCPEASIEMTRNKKQGTGNKEKADIDYEYCKGCGVCAQICPAKAIIMKKK